ncbi:RAD55 family ATPase [Pseudomonas sp.]|uniref:RAD55 family ATPase n=1 Tax=Pseudomonas sp. TaxID=306 RepID=UPI002729FB80|nr:ATPase domain-containing protein [Pseudomonas sp.]
MTDRRSLDQEGERLSTGVPGLDRVLQGGLLPRSVYIIQGGPGEGKTILANQLCYHRASQGERSLYVTLLAETHHRLIRHLRAMEFMREQALGDSVYYESAFDTLRRDGLEGVLRFLIRNTRDRKASFIVLDGLFALEESAETERSFREFINDLSVFADMQGCTVLLLTNSERGAGSPEFTMVDGWIELNSEDDECRSFRFLCVHKFRGSGFVSGRHMLAIDGRGVHVYPRLEALRSDLVAAVSDGRISSGVTGLDDLMDGGFPRASTTALVGPTGVGKTSFGLSFICQSTPEEPGLVFGFYEDARRLERRAAAIGIDLAALMTSGAVTVMHFPPTEQIIDSLAEQLLKAVRRTGARRLLVDGVDGFRQAAVYPSRLGRFLSMLTSLLRAEGVTTLFTAELPELMGGEQQINFMPLSPIAENIVLMRYAEIDSRLHRTVSIMKMRESGFSPDVHEFCLDRDGFGVRRTMRQVRAQGAVDASRGLGDA